MVTFHYVLLVNLVSGSPISLEPPLTDSKLAPLQVQDATFKDVLFHESSIHLPKKLQQEVSDDFAEKSDDIEKDYVPNTTKDRFIKLSEQDEAILMSESDIFELYKKKKKFIDVTDGDYDLIKELASSRYISSTTFPSEVAHQETVSDLIRNIDTNRMKKWLTNLTKFYTRYFKSKSGKESANWIFNELEELSKKTAKGVELIVEKFDHSWGQYSIIAKLHASFADVQSEPEIVILSAHQDSVNQWNPWFGRSPGADDNGSGSTTIWEVLSVLVESGYIPEKRNLEFHWYSAEEGGLLGSQKVVASYLQKKKPVFAVLHSDMTGYQPDGLNPVVGIATDFVNKPLSDSLIKITEAYSDIEWQYTKCGYGCSDHASWTNAGIPSSFTFEALFENSSPFIHSSDDTVQHISIEHISSFVKVVLGFVVEIGEA